MSRCPPIYARIGHTCRFTFIEMAQLVFYPSHIQTDKTVSEHKGWPNLISLRQTSILHITSHWFVDCYFWVFCWVGQFCDDWLINKLLIIFTITIQLQYVIKLLQLIGSSSLYFIEFEIRRFWGYVKYFVCSDLQFVLYYYNQARMLTAG